MSGLVRGYSQRFLGASNPGLSGVSYQVDGMPGGRSMIRLHKAGVIAALNLLVVAGLAAGASPAVAAAPVCQPGAPQPTNQYPGATVVATNFESGSLTTSGFAAPFTAGTGTAAVSSA